MYSEQQHFELAREIEHYYEEIGATMFRYPYGYNIGINQTFLAYLKNKYDILNTESIDWDFIDEAWEALHTNTT